VKNCLLSGIVYASELTVLNHGDHQVLWITARLFVNFEGILLGVNIGLRGTM